MHRKLMSPLLFVLPGDSYSESYTYDTGDGSLQSMTTAGGQTLSYTYDLLKRHSATTVAKNGSTIFTVAKSYYNQTTDTTLTTAQVQYYNVRNSAGTLIAGSQYVYDARGNITQIKESESPYRVLYAYEYDSLNQLTKETVYTYTGTSTTASSTTVNTFTYDTAGNLLTVSENGVVKDTYTYGNANWADLLTKFNGTSISYDASGNPLNWYNGNTYSNLTWVMGRQLAGLTMETDTENISVEYDYDMSGMRSSKTIVIGEVEAHTHEYTSVVTAPTCTTAGYTTYTCNCGESYVDNLIDAPGHNYVQSGNVYTCSRCGDSYTGHEHSYTETTTEPTCTEAGYTVYTCSCGDTYTVDLPALGHNYVLVNQNGNIGTYQCSRCGHTYTAVIPVTPPTEEYSLRSSNATVEHHEYIYASGKLLREIITTTANGTSTTEVLDFIYGSGSTPLALVYTNGTANPVTYYYVTNMQGDVVKLVTASGTAVATYAYDAWGKVLTATGSMAEVNPIRYRGYYYDNDTHFYYLQSRFYDPEVRRFVNADALASTGQGFIGQNMFAYCNNNPVNASDPGGYAANWTNRVDMQDGRYSTDPRSAPTWPRIPEEYSNKLKLFDFYIPYGTQSYGVYLSGTPFGIWAFTGQLGFSVDGTGDFIIQYGLYGGLTTGVGSSLSSGIYGMRSNAPTVDHLTGEGGALGGSAVIPIDGVPFTAGADVNFIPSPEENKTYLGMTVIAGLTIPPKPGGEGHAMWGETWSIEETRVNLYDLWDALFGGG